MTIIDFIGQLFAGEAHFAGIDDDNMVAAIDVRGVAWFMFAAEDIGDDCGNAANNQTFGINNMPGFFDILWAD